MSVQGINVPFLGKTTLVNNITTGINPANVILVQSSGDFPAPVANNITLASNKIYYCAGLVDIGSNFITFSEGSVLRGQAHKLDGIQSSYTGFLLNSSNVSLTIDEIKFSTPSGQVFNFGSNNNGRCNINSVQLSGCSGLGKISGFAALTIEDSIFFNNDNGLTIIGPGEWARLINNRSFSGRSPTYTGFMFPSGSNTAINIVDIVANTIITEQADQLPFFVNSGAVLTGLISSNSFADSTLNPISGGFSKADPAWTVASNKGINSSVAIGCMKMSGNPTATPFAAANQFVPISGFSVTGTLNERFRMFDSGVLQYYGKELFEGILVFNGFFASPSASNITWGFAFTKNGIVRDNAYWEAFTTATGVQTPICLNACITLNTNDTVGIAATNRTNTTSMTVLGYTFNVR